MHEYVEEKSDKGYKGTMGYFPSTRHHTLSPPQPHFFVLVPDKLYTLNREHI